MGQRFLDSVGGGVAASGPYAKLSHTSGNSMHHLKHSLSTCSASFLFHFIPWSSLYVYIYIYVALFVCLSPSIPSFSLPPSFLLFFNFSSIQCFLPPLFFHSFIHFIPFLFTFHICPFPFHNCASLTFETLISKTFKRKIPHHSSRWSRDFFLFYIVLPLHKIITLSLYEETHPLNFTLRFL